MSESYLQRRTVSQSEHNGQREELYPVRSAAKADLPDANPFDNWVRPLSGKEQLARILDMLFRRKWTVILGFLCVLGIAIVYTMTLVPQYQSSSYVLVDLGEVTVDVGRAPSQSENPDAGFEVFARSDRSLAGEIRLLEISDQLRRRVSRRLKENLGQQASMSDSSFSFPGKVEFAADEESENILEFTGTSSDGKEAALMANLYAEEYVRLTEEASRSQVVALRKSLEAKERQQRDELNFIEGQIQRLKQEGATGLDQESSRLLTQIAALEVQRDDARIELSVERATLASIESELRNINDQLANRISSGVERKIAALQEQLAQEEQVRSNFLLQNPDLEEEDSPALSEVNEQIHKLQAEIDSLSVQYVNEVSEAGGISNREQGLNHAAQLRQQAAEKRVSIGRMQAKLELLESRLRQSEQAMENLPKQSLEFAELERTRSRVDQMYQNTANQLQEAYIAEDSESGYAQVIRRAKTPSLPVYPDKPKNMILGAFFGLLVGCVLAFLFDKIDNRIYQPEQLRQLGLKEIGIIPDLRPVIRKEFDGTEFLEKNGEYISSNLISLLNPMSVVAESYRHLRTSIQFGASGSYVQTLLVSSPGMSEGKSTTASNLAIVMAQSGRKTLLVDADLRRPKVHRLFNLPRDAGLAEVLSNDSYFDAEALKTSIENLSVLTAGKSATHQDEGPDESNPLLEKRDFLVLNSSELLGSDRMTHFLSTMRNIYDFVIIDSPPVLAATDATLISSQCDATLVVARAGSTKEGELCISVEALEEVGGAVIGILLNGFEINMAYGHRYKYNNYKYSSNYAMYGSY